MVEGTRLEIERGVIPTVGSNPTPSAMTLNRPPKPINTRSGILERPPKRLFLGQMYLKVYLFGLEGSYPSEGSHKEETTLPLPVNGFSGDPVNYLHNRENYRNCRTNTAFTADLAGPSPTMPRIAAQARGRVLAPKTKPRLKSSSRPRMKQMNSLS